MSRLLLNLTRSVFCSSKQHMCVFDCRRALTNSRRLLFVAPTGTSVFQKRLYAKETESATTDGSSKDEKIEESISPQSSTEKKTEESRPIGETKSDASTEVDKAAAGSDMLQLEVVKNNLNSLVNLNLQQETIQPSSSDEEDEKAREASWRTMKYSLMFFGVSFVAVGSYLVYEFGKPPLDDEGHLLVDEFSALPTWKQYFYRTLKEIDYYNRMIKEPSRDKLLPDGLKEPYEQPRYTLILELIDVLVHPDWTYNTGWRFKKRPGLDYFLEVLSRSYEIVVYTAETGMTVFPIIEALDPKNYISYKLVRDATHFVDGHHVKNLDRLNRNLDSVVVVDWNVESVKFHPENVFKIPRWNGNDNDTTLIDLADFLLAISSSDVNDVREVLRHYGGYEDALKVFKIRREHYMQERAAERHTSIFNVPKHNFISYVAK